MLKEFANLFESNNIQKLSKTCYSKYMIDGQSNLSKSKRLIYWATWETQIEIGYMLKTRESFNNSNDDQNKVINYCFYMHHYYMTIECIYRVWERVTHTILILKGITETKNKHFHSLFANPLKNHFEPKTISVFSKLKPHWNTLKNERNKYSHEYSNLTHGYESILEESTIINAQGEPIIKKNEVNEIENLLQFVKEQIHHLIILEANLHEYTQNGEHS